MKSLDIWNNKPDSGYEEPVTDLGIDLDADYRPILQGIINTRCNYDGCKVEGTLEEG